MAKVGFDAWLGTDRMTDDRNASPSYGEERLQRSPRGFASLAEGDELDRALPRAAALHAPQGAIDRRAVREALELAEVPRFELWFLRAVILAAA
jgi:hypothetical protein